jgi:hypothetical protein
MRIIDHDRKLRNFMNTKTEDRSSILEQAIYKRQNKRMTNLLGNLKVEASKYEEIFSKIRAVSLINLIVSDSVLCLSTFIALWLWVGDITSLSWWSSILIRCKTVCIPRSKSLLGVLINCSYTSPLNIFTIFSLF